MATVGDVLRASERQSSLIANDLRCLSPFPARLLWTTPVREQFLSQVDCPSKRLQFAALAASCRDPLIEPAAAAEEISSAPSPPRRSALMTLIRVCTVCAGLVKTVMQMRSHVLSQKLHRTVARWLLIVYYGAFRSRAFLMPR